MMVNLQYLVYYGKYLYHYYLLVKSKLLFSKLFCFSIFPHKVKKCTCISIIVTTVFYLHIVITSN